MLFGGMIRDFALYPPKLFSSDIDLVVDGDDWAIERCLERFNATTNRFGGYRLMLGSRTVDIWALRQTWAFTSGHVAGHTFQELTQTTFFNWDAAVYELRSGTLHCLDNYFELLQSRVLDINLEANPNPAGNVLRALRLAFSGEAKLGARLTKYLLRFLDSADSRDFGVYSGVLERKSLDTIAKHLSHHLDVDSAEPFDIRNTQLRLSLPERFVAAAP